MGVMGAWLSPPKAKGCPGYHVAAVHCCAAAVLVASRIMAACTEVRAEPGPVAPDLRLLAPPLLFCCAQCWKKSAENRAG